MAACRGSNPQGGVLHADYLFPWFRGVTAAAVVVADAAVTAVAAAVAAAVASEAKITAVTPLECQCELAGQLHEDDGLAVPDAPSPEVSGGAEGAEAERRVERGHDAPSRAADPPQLTLAAVAVRVQLHRIELVAVVGGDLEARGQVSIGQDEDVHVNYQSEQTSFVLG